MRHDIEELERVLETLRKEDVQKRLSRSNDPEAVMLDIIREELADLQKEWVKSIGPTLAAHWTRPSDEVATILVDWDGFAHSTEAALNQPILWAYNQAGMNVVGQFDVRASFDLMNPRAVQWISQHGAELVKQIVTETQKGLQLVLMRAQTQGLSPWTAARQIKPLIGLDSYRADIVDRFRQRLLADGVSITKADSMTSRYANKKLTERSRSIARTEMHSAQGAGSLEGYKQLGIETKIWQATGDDRTRDQHAYMDGEEVPVDEPFSNGLMYPGDPSGPAEEVINCRCTMTAGRRKE